MTGTAPPASSPLVSIVIPTRDRAALLSRAIEAARAQTYRNLEVVIVDDGSADGTAEVIRRACSEDSRIRALRHETSRGAAAARNKGAGAARGRYLLFEDDDCRGVAERVEKLVRALEAAPDAALAYSWIRRSGTGNDEVVGRSGPWAIGTPTALIRRELFEAAGGFDEGLPRLQDLDLWTRLLARHRAVEVPEVLVETVRDGSGISASGEALVGAASLLLDKYHGGALPPERLAEMHRRVGGALLLEGRRAAGLPHFVRAIRVRPASLRSWIGLLAAGAGPAIFRSLIRIRGSR